MNLPVYILVRENSVFELFRVEVQVGLGAFLLERSFFPKNERNNQLNDPIVPKKMNA